MKIGIIHFDGVPSPVNQLMHVFLSKTIPYHQVSAIEIKDVNHVTCRAFSQEDIRVSSDLSKRLVSPSTTLEPNVYKVFLPFDVVIAIGHDSSLRAIEELVPLVEGTKFLIVPVSIYNDFDNGESSLGYDSALNSIVDSILRIRDTIDSLVYSNPRVFGIELPQRTPFQMVKEAALAIDGIAIPPYFREAEALQLETRLHKILDSSKNYSFLLYNERTSAHLNEHMDFSSVQIEFKVNKIDEAMCLGQRPTARDRIMATELGYKLAQRIPNITQKLNVFLIKNQKVYVVESEDLFS
ncbi:6-phosphofructokinase [Exiguobacterium sp. s22]|uniref:6-phosphofructokinase n=1 Tax=Exiguobacterium sp. s22 TaxID=2751272 RepID=UPI001BE6871C|nr:6-phosphofructokinase [Exiguobacterium sp. s22]